MTKYMQTDSRWGGLGYPKAPYYLRNCGCGEVSICNCIIEMEQYKAYTPATIQPYCKQYADPHGNGTYWSGIPAMMKHYGMIEVKEHATMKPLWDELAKGGRVAIYLMGSRKGGSKGVKWTSSGHFVCSTDYKYKDGKHYVYVKDSYSNSSLRNGWITYEDNMRNDVLKVWSGKLKSGIPTPYYPTTPYKGSLPTGTVKDGTKGSDAKAVQTFLNWCINAGLATDGIAGALTVSAIKDYQTQYGLKIDGIFGSQSLRKAKEIVAKYAPKQTAQDKAIAWARRIANDQSWHYVKWTSNAKTHECPICFKHPVGAYHGWNCIGFAYSAYAHGANIKIKHSNGVINNAKAEKILSQKTDKDATKIVQDALGSKAFVCIKRAKGMPQNLLKAGDICLYFKGSTYQHTFLYVGNGKMIDATSVNNTASQIAEHKALTPKVVIRYTGE